MLRPLLIDWRLSGFVLALVALVQSGCAMLPPQSFLDPTAVGAFPSRFMEQGIRAALSPREGPLGLANADDPKPVDLVPFYEEYRLGPNDVVAISIEDYLPNGLPFQAEREVSPTGFIRVPQLGLVQVAGLTENELEADLRNRIIDARILPDPIVQVVAAVRRNRFFSVIGSVGRPGTYNLSQPDTRLLDVLGLVGDMGPEIRRFYVIRRIEGPGSPLPNGMPGSGMPGAGPGSMPTIDEEDDGLIIPPPSQGDAFAAGMSFESAGGGAAGWRGPAQDAPAATQEADDRAALEQIIAPPGMRAPQTQPTEAPREEPTQRRFAPLVFDPVTGEMRESAPVAEPPEVAPPVVEEAWSPPGREDFDWEEVPEYTLAQRVIEIDARALRAGDPRYNIVVRERDLINVPVDIGRFFMMGEVARTGTYSFGGREVTLKQAIATAGGFTGLAWPSRCEIIRREPGTYKQFIYPVNLDRIFAGLEDDILLRDGDIVNVGTDVVAPFLFVIRNSFRFTYGFGFVYDRNFADKDAYGAKLNPQIREDQRRASLGLPF